MTADQLASLIAAMQGMTEVIFAGIMVLAFGVGWVASRVGERR